MAIGYGLLLKFGIIPLAIGIVIGVKHYWPNYQDDNPIEEMVEKIIESQTGIDVDITPLSKEKKDASTK